MCLSVFDRVDRVDDCVLVCWRGGVVVLSALSVLGGLRVFIVLCVLLLWLMLCCFVGFFSYCLVVSLYCSFCFCRTIVLSCCGATALWMVLWCFFTQNGNRKTHKM